MKILCLFAALGAAMLSSVALAQLKAAVFVTGLSLPVSMIQDPTNPNIQYVVQQRGRIRVIINGVLQATDLVTLASVCSQSGSERGLLGLAFAPDYATSGFLYVNYTDISTGATKIARLTRTSVSPPLADISTLFPIHTISQPYSNHNGGTLRFGPDGYLYIGMGDGGNSYDPGNRAQTLNNMLLGKMLRIDPTGDDFPADATRNYSTPASNPFNGTNGDKEIWSCGLRNPWKFSFDNPAWLGTGAMLIGDVGQDTWEEVDFEPAGVSGRNYGWRVREGFASTGFTGANAIPFTDPIHVYQHSGPNGQSITGGYVARGNLAGDLFGRYFFAEYIDGKVWSIGLNYDINGNATAGSLVEHTAELSNTGALGNISSLDVDSNGNLYLVSYSGGKILRLVPNTFAWITDTSQKYIGRKLGGVRELLTVDGKTYQMWPNWLVDSAAEENLATLIVGHQTDNFAATTLSCQVDGFFNQAGNGTVKVQLYNWSTSSYDNVITGTMTGSNQTFSVSGVSAANYRRAGDGRIQMLIKSFRPEPLVSYPLITNIDRVKITLP